MESIATKEQCDGLREHGGKRIGRKSLCHLLMEAELKDGPIYWQFLAEKACEEKVLLAMSQLEAPSRPMVEAKMRA